MIKKMVRLFMLLCPFCGEYRILAAPLKDAYWCMSEDCRTSERRNGVRALIWEKDNTLSNGCWIKVEVDE